MQREAFSDLIAFLAVAEERSFTKAAARLGTSQSALSYTVRRLETRMGVRLLNRTTRSVAPTEAGDQLLETLRPAFDDIDAKLAVLSRMQTQPMGTVRLTCGAHAAATVLWPAVAQLLPAYPELKVEISVDAALSDIVAERFDAGVRLGESVAKDMIAARIGPDLRMAVVASPAYFAAHGAPTTPHDLTAHRCINIRLPTAGGLYAWEFFNGEHSLNVRVDGPLVFNDMSLVLRAAEEGLGLACTLEDQAAEGIAAGRLVRVLEDWCEPFAGYHLYYASRRQPSSAFTLLVNTLRQRFGEGTANPNY